MQVSLEVSSAVAIWVSSALPSIFQPLSVVCITLFSASDTEEPKANVIYYPPVQVPINKACDAKAACCQGDNNQVRLPFHSSRYAFTNRFNRTVSQTSGVLLLHRLSRCEPSSPSWCARCSCAKQIVSIIPTFLVFFPFVLGETTAKAFLL